MIKLLKSLVIDRLETLITLQEFGGEFVQDLYLGLCWSEGIIWFLIAVSLACVND